MQYLINTIRLIISTVILLGMTVSASASINIPTVIDNTVVEQFEDTRLAFIFDEQRPVKDPLDDALRERYNTGWAFYIDNDVFSLGGRDRDYTGGFALTLSGSRAQSYQLSVDPILKSLDRFSGFDNLYEGRPHHQLHSLQAGLLVFTPEDIESSRVLENDRPYASLLFLSNTQQSVLPERNVAYQSTFTIGLLGSRLGAEVQKGLHKTLGLDLPKGWRNQIAAEGEITARYSVSRQRTHILNYKSSGRGFELKTSREASVGYTTDINLGVSARWGKISTPWWSFNPQQTEYIRQASPIVGEQEQHVAGDEFYFWAGASLRLRAYNAFLQGQFRDSAVTISNSELNPLIAEAWLGLTKQFNSGIRFSFVLRGRTAEIKKGPASRDPIWGGLIWSKAY